MKNFILFDAFFDEFILPRLESSPACLTSTLMHSDICNEDSNDVTSKMCSEISLTDNSSSSNYLARSFVRAEMRKKFLDKASELYNSTSLKLEPSKVSQEITFQGFLFAANFFGFKNLNNSP